MIDEIRKEQPIFFQLIHNALASNKLPHAFLLIGKNTNDSLEFLVKSILCDNVVACNMCDTCKKIDHKSYADIIYFDGLTESIKKQNIEYIQETFKKTSVEGKAKIYIIQNIEKSSKEAINALLKMVEEPEGDTIAIFTSKNKNRVLPTIISRCQTIELKHDSANYIYNNLIENNVEASHASVLSNLVTTVDEAKLLDDERFEYMMLQVVNTIEDMFTNRDNLLINAQSNLLKKYKEKNDIVLFLKMLSLAIKDMFHVKHNNKLIYINNQQLYTNLTYSDEQLIKKLQIINETINTLESNANIQLLMDSMFYRL